MGSGLLSPAHLAVVLAIALIVFGPKRLPELGRAIGHGMRGFKDALGGEDDDYAEAPPVPASTPQADATHPPAVGTADPVPHAAAPDAVPTAAPPVAQHAGVPDSADRQAE